MKKEITLESLYDLLFSFIEKQTGFNEKQEAFNSKQEAFNSKQEAFNAKQEAFNAKQEAFNAKQETCNAKQEAFNSKQEAFNTRFEEKFADFQAEERSNHNLSHRMIMQAFEKISDIREEMDDRREPWMRAVKK